MKLNAYLTKYEITSQEFSKKIGKVSLSSINKWRIANRRPRLKMIQKIERATNGNVTLKDWPIR